MEKFVFYLSCLVWIAIAAIPTALCGIIWLMLLAPHLILKLLMGALILFALWLLISTLISLFRFAADQ